jgi:hypothetical protein
MALSVADVLANPDVITGWTPEEFTARVSWDESWHVERLGKGGKEGLGWLLRQYLPDGRLTGRLVKWHPGGGHHGKEPYWRTSSREYGRSGVIR